MEYRTELHCHTREVSKCASASAEAMVEFYISRGYSSLVLTNHLSPKSFKNSRFGDLSEHGWDRKIDLYMNGYNRAKELAGDRLNVLLGCELRAVVNNNDYLIYGVTEEFLRSVPGIMDMKVKDISALVRSAGALLVQAHPFRNGMAVTNPDCLDGMEIFNGNLGHGNRNEFARMWSEKFNLIQTAGGDCHTTKPETGTSGIITEEPITSNEQLLRILRSGSYELIRYGDLPY